MFTTRTSPSEMPADKALHSTVHAAADDHAAHIASDEHDIDVEQAQPHIDLATEPDTTRPAKIEAYVAPPKRAPRALPVFTPVSHITVALPNKKLPAPSREPLIGPGIKFEMMRTIPKISGTESADNGARPVRAVLGHDKITAYDKPNLEAIKKNVSSKILRGWLAEANLPTTGDKKNMRHRLEIHRDPSSPAAVKAAASLARAKLAPGTDQDVQPIVVGRKAAKQGAPSLRTKQPGSAPTMTLPSLITPCCLVQLVSNASVWSSPLVPRSQPR